MSSSFPDPSPGAGASSPSQPQQFSSSTGPGEVVMVCESPPEPLASVEPCDIDTLMLVDHASGVSVRADRPMRGDPVTGKVPEHVRSLLMVHDVVLERAVDYVGRTKFRPEKKLVLRAAAKYVGSCGAAAHPEVAVAPLGVVECEPRRPRVWRANMTDKLEILGRSERPVLGSTWLAPFWFLPEDAQSWTVVGGSCGYRHEGAVNVALRGIVIAYPRDEYELSFTLPAWRSWEGKRSGSVNVAGGHEHQSSWDEKGFGRQMKSSESSTKVDRKGATTQSYKISERQAPGEVKGLSEKTSGGGSDGKYEYAQGETLKESRSRLGGMVDTHATYTWSESTETGAKLELEREIEFRPSVSLKKNGRELDVSRTVNNILNLAQRIRGAVEDIKNLVPSVGWSVRFDLKLMEGSITGKWGVQNAEDADAKAAFAYQGARYVAVRKFWEVGFDLIVFGASITLMVGVEVKVSAVFFDVGELVVKLEGKLSGEVTLKCSLTSDVPAELPKLKAALRGNVSGVVKANTAGISLVDALAELKGGFEFTGAPVVSSTESPRISGALNRLETTVEYYATSGKERPEPVPVPLFDAAELWKGEMPARQAPAA